MTTSTIQLPIELEELRTILRTHGVVKASVFGSYARGDARSDSDLDILVDYDSSVSLFGHFDLKQALEQALNIPVDVVSRRAVSRHLMPYIDRDKVTVL